MPRLPRQSGGIVSSISDTASVSRQELKRRQEELHGLKRSLMERELELSTLRSELHIFEASYHRTVGVRQAELERLKTSILEFAANLDSGVEAPGSTRKDPAADWMNPSFEEFEFPHDEADLSDLTGEEPFAPEESLKKLFREAARRFHPDLSNDPDEIGKRHDLMARLNAAYLEMDADRIRELIEEGELAFPDPEADESVRQRLTRVLKQTGQVRHRLLQIESTLESLQKSDMARLRDFCETGRDEGRDVLSEMAEEADEKIDNLKARIVRLADDCSLM